MVNSSMEKLQKNSNVLDMEQTADVVQELYTNLNNMITKHSAFAGVFKTLALHDDDCLILMPLTALKSRLPRTGTNNG